MDAPAAPKADTPQIPSCPLSNPGFVLGFKKSGVRRVHFAPLWKPVEKIPSTRNIATLCIDATHDYIVNKCYARFGLGGDDGATSIARGNQPRGG
jgi:hypothetical protein